MCSAWDSLSRWCSKAKRWSFTWLTRRSPSSTRTEPCRRRRNPMRSSSNDSSSICCPGHGIRSWWKGGAKRFCAGQERRRRGHGHAVGHARALVRLHTSWLHQAGVTVKPGALVEISPLWALDAKHAAERVTLPWTIDQPVFLTD